VGDDDLTVIEAAEALGTSPQTVRTLLRKGELPGRKRPWGSRYVWVPSRQGVDDFLSQNGRLDGHRRRSPRPVVRREAAVGASPRTATADVPPASSLDVVPFPEPDSDPEDPGMSDSRPFVLRPRGRATVVVVVLGVPLALMYAAARILPGALWFDELGQADVFARVAAARAAFYLLVAGSVALLIGTNLVVATRRTVAVQPRTRVLLLVAASLGTGTLFASSVTDDWQTFLLWRHRQPFGVVDPIHGKDLGFFVFSLPFELLVSGLLLWLVAVATCYVVLVYAARGALGLRPRRATFRAQVHVSFLAALFLLVGAWRLRLEQYVIELGQASVRDSQSFSGAGYVDVQVRLPGLAAAAILAIVLAVACVAAPFVARAGRARVRWILGIPVALLAVAATVAALVPSLVQRFVVDPNPLLSEQPYLERSIAATRSGLALDTVDVQPYSPTGRVSPAEIPGLRERVADVVVWDPWLLEPRMRELVTDTPYYRPDEPALDPVRVSGKRELTVVSARELDVGQVRGEAQTWASNRLAYTHGLGLIRFSATQTDRKREPRLVEASPALSEPRIYFGSFPQDAADAAGVAPELALTADRRIAESPWVLVNTRRPEVDVPTSGSDPTAFYHYEGTGGINLSDWARRASIALALGSKELLLSDDITSDSRILLHRDVHDRLRTLAPFIQWDSHAVPLTANGRVVFVVDGYTTSENYPYAEQVDLGGTRVNYARASVRATVDAFSGRVGVYLTDESDPIARAWDEAFPNLFRPEGEMPAELRPRLRYPGDLFDAQATAYERFHTTQPDLFVSEADAWSRPIALSGPIEVAGDVDFDESDEDDLRLTMEPSYFLSTPPGTARPRLILRTYYTPQSGQNLVGTLSGWVDQDGQEHLSAQNLLRDPVTLGPAQMSRFVFSTSRVRNLLGLRNLEIRDLDTSSLDAVLLGRPHVLMLPAGVLQIQSLYEGTRGPGAARLLGVTVYLNGRAGLGPDIDSALRQALNSPPRTSLLPPPDPIIVGTPVKLAFRVKNARREVITITSDAGITRKRLELETGRGTVEWVPPVAGDARVRIEVIGLDGTRLVDSAALTVLRKPPTIRLIDTPAGAVVGKPLRVSFKVTNGVAEWAKVATRSGIEVTRRYLIRNGTGVVGWTPQAPGSAVLLVRVRGHDGQTATTKVRIVVVPLPEQPPPPVVAILRVPEVATVGRGSVIAFRADGCRLAVARVEGPDGDVHSWSFPCPADRATFTWTPSTAGQYRFTAFARGTGTTTQTTTLLTAVDP